MAKSTIEWTESTWNPITGCTKISAGCKNCYASILAKRLHAMGQKKYQNGFLPTMHPDTLNDPFKWKNGKLVFVNSMSDSFHKEFPLTFIQQMFSVMNETPRHTYQVLTKRAERLEEFSTFLNWTDNIWMGVSVENEKTIDRIDHLRKTKAKVKFLSCEPLIGPLPNINLEGIDWVIVGGESGPNSRPMEKEWVDDIQQQCEKAGVAFFFKQWGGVNKKKTGRLLNGRTYDEMPSIA
jgi:protein gp37